MAKWILVNIGCIECGVPSQIVGVFDDQARAEALAESLCKSHGWRHGGQNDYEVFPMPKLNAIHPDYVEEP